MIQYTIRFYISSLTQSCCRKCSIGRLIARAPHGLKLRRDCVVNEDIQHIGNRCLVRCCTSSICYWNHVEASKVVDGVTIWTQRGWVTGANWNIADILRRDCAPCFRLRVNGILTTWVMVQEQVILCLTNRSRTNILLSTHIVPLLGCGTPSCIFLRKQVIRWCSLNYTNDVREARPAVHLCAIHCHHWLLMPTQRKWMGIFKGSSQLATYICSGLTSLGMASHVLFMVW